jgi:hypothetical protein
MELMNHLMAWLNAEEEHNETVLQRDGVFALLSWRDFNQPAQSVFTFRTAALLFILAVGLPVLVLS